MTAAGVRAAVSGDARERRVAALRASLAVAQLDALLITSLSNVRYCTDFSGSAAILVVTSTELVLLTDFRYSVQAASEVGEFARVIIEPTSLWSRLWTVLPQLGPLDQIGFESAHLAHGDFQRLVDSQRDVVRWQWRPTANVVEMLRSAKDECEVLAIREAVGIAERALERTVAAVRAGMTEFEICGLLERELRAAGSEAHPFETIVASGERSALPHARCSGRCAAKGEWLLLDFGAVHKGYCSDITRTFVVGRASDEQRSLHAVVRESNMTASGGVRAGMRGKDADALARGYIERHGWGQEFGHSLGHGIGLEVHEAPRLSKANDAPLPERAVVTIEPGIYRPGWGGVRIEDDVFLTGDGPQVLTTFPRELLEIG
ncbi:MAG TPA: Xaa-Pro peptidase family protein [Gemmatimonadaceae bacterium]|nr:Xaa-Pro peptidase family protein [Gemmatimonadaceae bacterium]